MSRKNHDDRDFVLFFFFFFQLFSILFFRSTFLTTLHVSILSSSPLLLYTGFVPCSARVDLYGIQICSFFVKRVCFLGIT